MKKQIKTIDGYCGLPTGAFKAFIEKKEAYLKEIEDERKAHIKAAHTTSKSKKTATSANRKRLVFLLEKLDELFMRKTLDCKRDCRG